MNPQKEILKVERSALVTAATVGVMVCQELRAPRQPVIFLLWIMETTTHGCCDGVCCACFPSVSVMIFHVGAMAATQALIAGAQVQVPWVFFSLKEPAIGEPDASK